MPEVGDTVYQFDLNRRVYAQDASGRAVGGPIFREHFKPFVIEGEEKNSWLVAAPGSRWKHKVAKNQLITAEQVDDRCWVEDYRIKIARLVQECRDPTTLKSVAAVMGYLPAIGT